MTKQATARLKPSDTGDNVLLQTPEIDRGRGDPVSLLEIVLDKTAGGFKVGTMQGFMSRKLCCTRQLEASKLEQRKEFCLGNLEETNWRWQIIQAQLWTWFQTRYWVRSVVQALSAGWVTENASAHQHVSQSVACAKCFLEVHAIQDVHARVSQLKSRDCPASHIFHSFTV